ncbi:DEKNAAC101647 [Brettanomyces naardenensis]|uniref:Cysteine protease RIM13 n=1 Tax=Brettanomyces naardenensis TaxID=13370 RepID=A0A448YI75_BRENA|nr:DEKNAAC101647 [Brettanomyces naardenensis]
MEKAFLQVHGCTDISAFRGSNFGNDCHLLTSFLPEYIPIQELTRSLIDSIYQEFLSKNVLLGLAVGRLTDDEVVAFHLVPNHDYCITDITFSNDDYLFTIRNPSLATNPFQTLSLKDLYAMFQTFYVNWNSDRFAHGAKKTFVIPSTIGSSSYIDYPQFTIDGAPSSSIWILLEGHMGREGTGSVISSVLCYDTDHKLWTSDDSEFISSTPVNNPLFTLCKLSVPADGCLTAVLRLTDVTSSHFYTIHCYSQEPLSIHRSMNKLKHFKQLAGSWSIGESGGPWSEDTYWENPQYEITTEDTSPVSIGLFTSSSLHVSLNIFDNDFNDFNRVVGFKEKDLIQSEQYTDGLSLSRTTLQAGKKYVIVCSTYHVDDLGAFKLAVNSNSVFSLRPLLTGLGLFKKRIDGANVSRRGWETIARFLLKRRSRVAIKVTGKTNRVQLRGIQTGEVVYSAVSSRKTTFLGSQKETISDGEYEVQVTSEKDCTVDAEIWTDYIISSTDES